MDVTCDDDWGIEFQQVWLANENLLRFLDEHFYLLFSEVDWLYSKVRGIWSDVVSDFEKFIDNVIEFVLVDSSIAWITLSYC